MEVIPLILSEEMADLLPMDFLIKLSTCSTEPVLKQVDSYLSDSNHNKATATKIGQAFSDVLMMREYLRSEQLKESASLLADVNLMSISPSVDLTELEKWKTMIESILSNKYATPYTSPISGSILKDLRATLFMWWKANGDERYKELHEFLRVNANLFRDSRFAHSRGTVIKKVMRKRDQYAIVLAGLDFMIDKKQKGKSPASWRYL